MNNVSGAYSDVSNPASYCFISSFDSGTYWRSDNNAGKVVWQNPSNVACGDEYKPYYDFNYKI